MIDNHIIEHKAYLTAYYVLMRKCTQTTVLNYVLNISLNDASKYYIGLNNHFYHNNEIQAKILLLNM